MENKRRLIDLDKIKPMDFPSYEMDGLDVVQYLNTLPTVDAVSIEIHKQVQQERDIAIEQLSEIGKSLGEKMDDVAYIVHGCWKNHNSYPKCSECGYMPRFIDDIDDINYCPNCGAKIDLEE